MTERRFQTIMKKLCIWIKGIAITKWFQHTTWVQKGILFLMVMCIIPFWPLGLVREEVQQLSGSESHAWTGAIEPGMTVTQAFQASHGRLLSLEIVLDYDVSQVLEGNLLFEILDAEDNILYQQKIPYDQIDNYAYYPIEMNLKLKRYHIYKYCVTNLDITENMPKAVYTVDEKMHAAPNRQMTFNGETVEGKAMTRYKWNATLRFHNLLAVAACIGVTGFTLIEIAERKK